MSNNIGSGSARASGPKPVKVATPEAPKTAKAPAAPKASDKSAFSAKAPAAAPSNAPSQEENKKYAELSKAFELLGEAIKDIFTGKPASEVAQPAPVEEVTAAPATEPAVAPEAPAAAEPVAEVADPVLSAAPARSQLQNGSTGPEVAELQQKLEAAGHSPGAIDGEYGPQTEAAVRNYQTSRGLEVDGIVGPQTWGALDSNAGAVEAPPAPAPVEAPAPAPSEGGSGPILQRGHGGEPVRQLQQRLLDLGFDPNGVDGDFGPGTDGAVRNFQGSRGLEVDGVVGPQTWNALGIHAQGEVTGGPGASGPVAGPSDNPGAGSGSLADNARNVAMSMGGYNSQGLCATGVSRAIANTYGISVWGNGNQIDDNLPKDRFRQVNMSIEDALRTPGLILTWETSGTGLGQVYGHTAITAGDGLTSYSDFIERNTIAGNQDRTGLKIFAPI